MHSGISASLKHLNTILWPLTSCRALPLMPMMSEAVQVECCVPSRLLRFVVPAVVSLNSGHFIPFCFMGTERPADTDLFGALKFFSQEHVKVTGILAQSPKHNVFIHKP